MVFRMVLRMVLRTFFGTAFPVDHALRPVSPGLYEQFENVAVEYVVRIERFRAVDEQDRLLVISSFS